MTSSPPQEHVQLLVMIDVVTVASVPGVLQLVSVILSVVFVVIVVMISIPRVRLHPLPVVLLVMIHAV